MTDKPDKVTRALAMRAKCHECMGGYIDGREDCGVTACPLYSWMPYAGDPAELTWLEYNPKRVGKVRWEDSGREMTEEDRKAAADRLSMTRNRVKKKKHETIYTDELGLTNPDEDDEDENE